MTNRVTLICSGCHGKRLVPVVSEHPVGGTQLTLKDCPMCDGKGSIEVELGRDLKPPTIVAVFEHKK